MTLPRNAVFFSLCFQVKSQVSPANLAKHTFDKALSGIAQILA